MSDDQQITMHSRETNAPNAQLITVLSRELQALLSPTDVAKLLRKRRDALQFAMSQPVGDLSDANGGNISGQAAASPRHHVPER